MMIVQMKTTCILQIVLVKTLLVIAVSDAESSDNSDDEM